MIFCQNIILSTNSVVNIWRLVWRCLLSGAVIATWQPALNLLYTHNVVVSVINNLQVSRSIFWSCLKVLQSYRIFACDSF